MKNKISASGPLFVAFAMLTAGCGAASSATSVTAPSSPASSSAATSQAAGSTTDKAAAYKAVCALFTRDEAQAVVGDTAQLAAAPAPLADLTAGSVVGIGEATTCEYWTVPPDMQGIPADAAQNLHGFPAFYLAVDTKLVSWQLVVTNNKREPVSGLGGEAYYVPAQLEGDKTGGYLVAHKGTKYLWISRGQFAGDAAPDVKDREVTLARSVLAKI